MSRILRYEVPVDGQWHTITGASRPVHVGCRQVDTVEFWAWDRPDVGPVEYCVFGTGQPVEEPCAHMGTTIAPGGQLVWHLVRRT